LSMPKEWFYKNVQKLNSWILVLAR
jgi:hypothetical protein